MNARCVPQVSLKGRKPSVLSFAFCVPIWERESTSLFSSLFQWLEVCTWAQGFAEGFEDGLVWCTDPVDLGQHPRGDTIKEYSVVSLFPWLSLDALSWLSPGFSGQNLGVGFRTRMLFLQRQKGWPYLPCPSLFSLDLLTGVRCGLLS